MEAMKWSKLLRACKREQKQAHPGLSLVYHPMGGYYTLGGTKHCKACGHEETRYITFKLKEEHELTVFESEMIFKVIIEHKIPFDYGAYHKTVAGKKFIKMLFEVKVKEEKLRPQLPYLIEEDDE